jgi:hypothetical protein
MSKSKPLRAAVERFMADKDKSVNYPETARAILNHNPELYVKWKNKYMKYIRSLKGEPGTK